MKISVVCTLPLLVRDEPSYMLYHIHTRDTNLRLRVRMDGNSEPYKWVIYEEWKLPLDEIPNFNDMSEEEFFQYSVVHNLSYDLETIRKTQELFMQIRNERFSIGVQRTFESDDENRATIQNG